MSLTVGDRLNKAEEAVQARVKRHNSLTSGHRACQGCGEALAARCALDAAYNATGGKIVVVNATGCLEVFTTPYPDNAWGVPWVHSLFGNAAAVATGMAAAFAIRGDNEVRVIAQGGDGGTTDIGMGCLSGMFERNDDVLYICYNNEAYMNTGVQRSSSTPALSRTATTFPIKQYMGNDPMSGKCVPKIAMAHGIPYVATATIGDIRDFERKVVKAIHMRGARYIEVYSPCPLGWGSQPCDTIRLARLVVRCGLYPLFEAENGKISSVTKIENLISVEDYLRPQKRFAHLFGKNADPEHIKVIQKIADANIEEYNLTGGC